ncbi:MAG: UDP-2,3-diacylglucosamine diphosphatase [Balneolaceae bacterium]
MQQLFISDAHLGAQSNPDNDQLENELIRIVDYCEKNRIMIHILGDLFDYWMEFQNYTPPLGRRLLERFSELHKKQNPGYFITGNHDFWTTGHFKNCGFHVNHESVLMRFDKIEILLLHGDGLDSPDMYLPRPLLHKVLRHPRFISLFQFIFNGKSGNHLMKTFSEFTRNNSDLNTEKLTNWALKVLTQQPIDYIITGHDHVPRMETFSGGTYINTGAYYLHRTAVIYNNGSFELVTWNDELQLFEPMTKPI